VSKRVGRKRKEWVALGKGVKRKGGHQDVGGMEQIMTTMGEGLFIGGKPALTDLHVNMG
jgi:hypothetical protein